MKQIHFNKINTSVKVGAIPDVKTNASQVLISLFIFSMLLLMLSSCTNMEKQRPVDSINKKAEESSKSFEDSAYNSNYEIVPNEKVCMVNDRYMGVSQIPIEVSGITYYGCCENCIEKLQKNLNDVRFGGNPSSDIKIDKASAVIVQDKNSGSVFYFASKDEANAFMKKQ
ncbi:MAG: hypothetical protein CMO34_02965 [Verrucomicrobia bacterium]|nr:hypothetical protein [Verrucomicrobiota bacterium]|tara:strand:+ start:1079 stop:1588 length:510 start_codon:yes stop_codon:yes gene_type:complete